MPRPKPSEELFPTSYRLTRTQIRKVKRMGVAWLRELISNAPTEKKQSPVDRLRAIKLRDTDICSSTLTTQELADKYTLSIKRVQQIRRNHVR